MSATKTATKTATKSAAAKAANKTQATDASVQAYLDAIDDAARRADCQALAALMQQAAGQPARLWGSAIVGFGTHRYRYDSGREGEICAIGFSSRKGDISVYGLTLTPAHEALRARLGKHKMGVSCLYLKRMADVDSTVLAQWLAGSAAERHNV